MTKEEIYIQLGYTGSYTKEVKKRLRQLIKKYHPDVYHGDDTIMKLLNEVREEIENDHVDSIFYQKKRPDSPQEPVVSEPFEEDYFAGVSEKQLSSKIEQLKKIRADISKILAKVDREIHQSYEVFSRRMQKYEEIKLKIETLQKEKKNHFGIVFLTTFGIIFLLLWILSFHWSLFLLFIVFLLLSFFLVYAFLLFKKQKLLNREISRNYANKNSYFNQVLDAQKMVEQKEKERFDQYVIYRKYADDIQLYHYELSKKAEPIHATKRKQESQKFK